MNQRTHDRVQRSDDRQSDRDEIQRHGKDHVALDGRHHPL